MYKKILMKYCVQMYDLVKIVYILIKVWFYIGNFNAGKS